MFVRSAWARPVCSNLCPAAGRTGRIIRTTSRNCTMSLRLGDVAPDFEQESSIGRIRFHEWLGDSWGVLFLHPACFTPVCTTELGLTAKLASEFDKRSVKTIALSVDSKESHSEWIKD